MSVSGTFAMTLHTPIGEQQGRLVLIERDGALSGTVSNPKGSAEFTGGTVSGGHVEFQAKLPTPLGRVKASVSGDVDGDVFTGTAKIPLGKVGIEGVRVPGSATE